MLWKVFKGDPLDNTIPYRKWFRWIESNMNWHHTDFEDNINKNIWIVGLMDGKAGTWYNPRAEYTKKYFQVDEWNPIVSAMEERFLNIHEEWKALGNMRELKFKGDIESYLMDIETFNYKVYLVSISWRTLPPNWPSSDWPPPDWMRPDWPASHWPAPDWPAWDWPAPYWSPPDWPASNWLLPDRLPPDWPSPNTPPISNNHGLQVHLQSHSSSALKCISNVARFCPLSASPISLNHGLQVHLEAPKITEWWNSGALRAFKQNTWERAVLPEGESQEAGEWIWMVTRPWWTAQITMINEASARVCKETHKVAWIYGSSAWLVLLHYPHISVCPQPASPCQIECW